MYLASSIVTALSNNTDITTFDLDLVTCPVQSCITSPEQCSKGETISCKKKVDIVYEHNNHNKVVILIFHYQLNGRGTEGFIRKDDLALKLLIKNNVIDENILISV